MTDQLKLEPLCEYYAVLKDPVPVGDGPYGNRQIFDVIEGEVTGARLRGRILPSGGDWLLLGTDGVGRLDVRATIETHDGAMIYLSYYGVLHMTGKVMEAIAGKTETQFGETYFYTNPRFETGDPRYTWLNGRFIIAQGRLGQSRVIYRLFEVQ